jgi:hypothetical protein
VIINISSISRAGNIGQTNYSAAKAGVVAMTTTLAKELARFGIRTGAIAPGFVGTEMVMSMKPEALEMMTKGIPAQRVGEPDEIAQAVAFILENDYFSGRVIEVDGAPPTTDLASTGPRPQGKSGQLWPVGRAGRAARLRPFCRFDPEKTAQGHPPALAPGDQCRRSNQFSGNKSGLPKTTATPGGRGNQGTQRQGLDARVPLAPLRSLDLGQHSA